MIDIQPLAESEIPEARRVMRLAFGTHHGVADPESFWSDRDFIHGRFGAEHTASLAARLGDTLAGTNFVTRWGSVGFFGPLTVRPDLWNRNAGQRLVGAAGDVLDGWGVRHAGLFTFPQSAKHVATYGKFGFYPRYLTAIMAAPAQPGPVPAWSRYAALPESQRRQIEGATRELTEEIHEGLDLGGEIRTVLARDLGDSILVWEGDSRLAGFAVCHWGPHSEAGAKCLYVKFGAVRPGHGSERRFAALLDACGALARAAGMQTVLAGVNLAREEAYRHMLGRGFRTQVQGVAMHRPNEPGYSRSGLFVLDDWR